ncbi:RIPOR family member 3 isoform X2 [Denticeps clupeoides]|uniref:FAM65 N-terminal domain-containing protein n=1 Tax=Denticeps clupeoides TaxID=299321 RepID=A0AAY4ETG3_9TELE|nr:RIPOR family member 3 isoform X2 [Denticeps clupeoides]
MSVKLRFENPSEGGMVQRSRSFTGLSSVSSRRRVSSARSSLRAKGQSGKSPKMPAYSRVAGTIWGQQPEQVDRIFQALRKGLKEYLEAHQTEMDFLSSQQRDTKRNSRLAFLYDLEKEIRALERYIRRLDFHISKVEELYETYCIQWRLCQGAVNMKRAFSLSPSSRASRESLLELSRNHRHSLEDMSAMEGELEILLGELHIKMKGLIGFARLCPGDQYEVVIRLGRQRWRIRGKIQTDDRQLWDEEEMIFLPHIHENFEIKVTEVKGLGSILVGMVICKSADFFMTQPQMMVVDITELGTLKLQLEVVWNPFDSGEVRPLFSSPSRQSLPSRKGSLYSWTPPNTPSFTEKYFISMVRQLKDPEGSFSLGSRESRGVSLLSYLSDASQAYEQGKQMELDKRGSPRTPTDNPSKSLREETMGENWPPRPGTSPPSPDESRRESMLLFHRYSTPDILRQNGEQAPPGLDSPLNTSQETDVEAGSSQAEQPRSAETARPEHASPQAKVGGVQRRAVALRISTLLAALDSALEEQGCTETQLRGLEKQVQHFSQTLKNEHDTSKASSNETLAVDEVLGSFDFLSTDFNADEISCMGSVRIRDTGISSFQDNTLRSLGLISQGSPPQTERDVGEHLPLSTGIYSLDQSLETHLSICAVLLRALRSSESELVRKDILEELTQQLEVLEEISKLSVGKSGEWSLKDAVPSGQKQRILQSFWEECSGPESPFSSSAEAFLQTLRKRFIHKVKAKLPGQPDAVFMQLLQQIQASCRMVPTILCNTDRVTVFQFFRYFSRWGLADFGEHISRLSKEVYLQSAIESPKRRRALEKLSGKRIAELQPLGRTLRILSGLQADANHKVARAAASCLCRAAGCRSFRAKAVVYYTEVLKDSDVKLQLAACLALKCLKASESAEQVAELWRSTDEDLRNAAKETVLSFGKKGYVAFQRMDRIHSELQEEVYLNLDTEITIL